MVSPKGGASSQRLDHLGRRGGREILFWSIARFSVCDPFSVFCFVSASVIYHYMHLVRHGTHFLKPQTQRHSRLHPSSLFFLFFLLPLLLLFLFTPHLLFFLVSSLLPPPPPPPPWFLPTHCVGGWHACADMTNMEYLDYWLMPPWGNLSSFPILNFYPFPKNPEPGLLKSALF